MSLAEYQISQNGFLPESCLTQPPKSFAQFQPLLDHLSTPDGHLFRKLVDGLPTYSPETYSIANLSTSEKQFVYTIITFAVQKYIWCCGKENLLNTIPQELGIPLLEISKDLGMPPILNYAATILYNWSPKDQSKPLDLDNLQVNYKLIENPAYNWFSIIHMAIEARGGAVLKAMMDVKTHLANNNIKALRETFTHVTEALRATNTLLLRMYDNCSPDDFWKFRFYFEGTNDTNLFPNGLQVKGVEHEPIVFVGISGAQSTLIQAFDAFFGVEHEGHGKIFLNAMRNYMPTQHRKFIENLGKGFNIKEYVMKSGDDELRKMFAEAINRFTVYRQTHLRLVHDYILQVISQRKKEAEKNIEQGENGLYKEDGVGTGGTDAKELLQQAIQETRETKDVVKTNKNLSEKKDNGMSQSHTKFNKDGSMSFVVETRISKSKVEDILVSVIVGIIGSYVTRLVIAAAF